jgi:transposase
LRQSFTAGVRKDKAAVRAGLTRSINNGMVEGHVTKLKLIKQQMGGKIGFARYAQTADTVVMTD